MLFLTLWYYFIMFGWKQYGSCLCDMQITFEMVSNAHVHQRTVSIYTITWLWKFARLWHKGLLPNVFHNTFQYASEVYSYYTRYAAPKKFL